MTITTRDQLINALANNSGPLTIDKASLSSTAAGQIFSMFRVTGTPGQATAPTTAAVCTSALTGALPLVNQTAPATSYIALLSGAVSNNASSVEIHDRLAHMGGLSGTVITAQGALSLATTAPSAARLGNANYSDVSWWLEWYTDTGGTSTTATVNVTYDNDATENLAAITLGTTARAGRMFPLIPVTAGRSIKAVNSVTLTATTGTAGNFGITATRHRTAVTFPTASKLEVVDWAQLGLPEIYNDSCLMLVIPCTTTTTGTIRCNGKIIRG
jgi:hypothetical protein